MEVPFSSHPCQHLLFFAFSDNSHSNRCEVLFHCVLTCISLMISDTEYLFMCLLTYFYAFFGEMSVQILCPFKNNIFPHHWIIWVLYVFRILTSNQKNYLQIFSPIQEMAFSFCWWFPLLCRLIYSHLYIFASVSLFLVSDLRHHHQNWCQVAYCLCFLLELLWFQVLN